MRVNVGFVSLILYIVIYIYTQIYLCMYMYMYTFDVSVFVSVWVGVLQGKVVNFSHLFMLIATFQRWGKPFCAVGVIFCRRLRLRLHQRLCLSWFWLYLISRYFALELLRVCDFFLCLWVEVRVKRGGGVFQLFWQKCKWNVYHLFSHFPQCHTTSLSSIHSYNILLNLWHFL